MDRRTRKQDTRTTGQPDTSRARLSSGEDVRLSARTNTGGGQDSSSGHGQTSPYGPVSPSPSGDSVVELVLPYPVSANRYWSSFVPKGWTRAVVAVTAEAKEYRKAVAEIANRIGLVRPFGWRVRVELDLFPHRPQDWLKRAAKDPLAWDDYVQCIDLGNAEKVLSDALQGIVFEDDRWIWDLHKRRMEPDGEGRVVLRVRPMQRQQHPQASLL